MPRKAKRGENYYDHINKYIIECVGGHPLFKGRSWAGQHRRVLAEKLNRKLKSHEIAHHIDKYKTNNEPSNIELTTRKNHPTLHKGQQRSEEVKDKMKEAAIKRCTPEWRRKVSKRVKRQHKAGKFGRKTWRK